MKRLCFLAVVAVVASGVMTSARMSATWVLTSGERVSGNINQHTDAKTNISRAQFAVGMPDGTEREVPVDQVASIEFVGGDPPMTELEKLPATGHMIALRDGSTLNGRLLNMVNGELVRWLHTSGELRGHRHPHDQPCVHEHGERAAHLSLRARDAACRRRRGRGDAGRTRGDRSRGHPVERHRTWRSRRNERVKFNPSGPDSLGPELGHDQRPRRQPAHQEPGLSGARDERRRA